MDRHFQEFKLVGEERAYLEPGEIAMLEPRGLNTVATLRNGKEVPVSGDLTEIEAELSGLHLQGIGQYRISPGHVSAILSIAGNGCRIHLTCGKWIESRDLHADDVRSAIENQQQYCLETEHLKVGI